MAVRLLSKIERWFLLFFDLGRIVLLVAILLVVFYYTLGQFFIVKGVSMDPNFEDGQWLLVSKINHYFHPPQRGEVVVFYFPGTEQDKYIKRVIGVPGDHIQIDDNKIFVNGEQLYEGYIPKEEITEGQADVELEKDEFFVLGDNRDQSNDSRAWGPLPRQKIIGQAVYLLFPFADRQVIAPPGYHLENEPIR